ncbi:MAG: hypothetical protein ACHQC8_02580 [Solirubrobacterales bacterium]
MSEVTRRRILAQAILTTSPTAWSESELDLASGLLAAEERLKEAWGQRAHLEVENDRVVAERDALQAEVGRLRAAIRAVWGDMGDVARAALVEAEKK